MTSCFVLHLLILLTYTGMFDSFFQSRHLTVKEKVLFLFCPFRKAGLIVQKVLIQSFRLHHFAGCMYKKIG